MKTTLQIQVFISSTICAWLGALALFSAASLRADILVTYDMQTAGARTNASFVGSGLTASSLIGNNLEPGSPGSATLANGDPNNYYTAWSFIGSGGSTAADAINSGDFFKLTLTPTAGNELTITSLSFDAFAGTAGPSARQIYVFSENLGVSGGPVLLTASTVSGSPLIPYNTATAGQNFSVDLSGYSGLADVTSSVTFRFYTQTPTASQNIDFDNITISGVVNPIPAPEPSTFALVGGGGALALLMVRSRRFQV
jgi:hypothetical protein